MSLWIKHSNVAQFEAFERSAARLMAKHGGQIERAMRVQDQPGRTDDPFEVHIVSFPNEAAFLAYQDDPDVRALGCLRDEIISKSTVLMGHDIQAYA